MPLGRVASRVAPNAERRRAHRLRTWLRVDYCPLVILKAGGLKMGGPQRAVARDLSPTGIFLTEVGYLPVDTVIHLFLRLPDVPGNPVGCYGRVVRTGAEGGTGYGVRFLRLCAEDARRLERYVGSARERAEPRAG